MSLKILAGAKPLPFSSAALLNWNKTILTVFALLFAGVTVLAGLFFLQMNRELTNIRAQETSNQRRLAAAQTKLEEQERYLQRLKSDPKLLEQVIRRKLGYVRTEEFVFRFDDQRQP
ncbi:MAG: septum formation initiator family protein [Candidatus Didemnitutus sp.]|nr:septum formation initiator family protein [Candidatus Didemnitutus sp.]